MYHSRQFILFTVHGKNTFNYKNSLTKNYLPELIIALNSRRENNIVILEADLSNKASCFSKLAIIIFLITLSFSEKHVHKKHEAEIGQKLRSSQAECQTITLKNCFCQ